MLCIIKLAKEPRPWTLSQVRTSPSPYASLNSLTIDFNVGEFHNFLHTKEIGRHIVYRKEADSTLRIAAEQAKVVISLFYFFLLMFFMQDQAVEGTVVIADHLISGREKGSAQKSGKNLFFSIIFRHEESREPSKIAVSIPAAIAFAARKIGVNAWAKWPHDICIRDKNVSLQDLFVIYFS